MENKIYMLADRESGVIHKIGDKDLCMDTMKSMVAMSTKSEGVVGLIPNMKGMLLSMIKSLCVYEVVNDVNIVNRIMNISGYMKTEEFTNLLNANKIVPIFQLV